MHVNFNDHLGSPRVRTAGIWGGAVTRTDYYPFGGEHNPSATSQNYKFTGQERDSETGSVHCAESFNTARLRSSPATCWKKRFNSGNRSAGTRTSLISYLR